ncbi:hypothetical protein [Aeromicrobium terrae]|uniref:DUF1330 domain-containing protein n=1 Tax=Aeromicrobium terrae TaxID=2498846 RepID=A0A5C8NF64_9ACTN|nr:hypothetical protein [Aeromicrobium terrae]TXL57611.1 hypothetical protein FHP06_12530 [Aeromicrobium terrae]
MAITFGVLLWAHAGLADDLTAYEDDVLALLPDHGGRVDARLRSDDPAAPTEMQVITFADEAGFESYMADPRRTANTDERDRVIARTELYRGIPAELS